MIVETKKRAGSPLSTTACCRRSFRAATLILLFGVACASAPSIPTNRHGLEVVGEAALYQRLVRQERANRLVDLQTFIPGIALDVRYATAENFMKRPLYPAARSFLRYPAALALRSVQRELAAEGLAVKVFDGYRPYRVTEAMWEQIGNPDYVADPAKGSRHNRGAAVDLTLVRLSDGEELEMPTPYDDFTAAAAQDAPAGVVASANRARLREVMQRHGFEPLPSEWWHFDFGGWREYDLMDLSFEDIDEGGRH